jgi:hypothetical protein
LKKRTVNCLRDRAGICDRAEIPVLYTFIEGGRDVGAGEVRFGGCDALSRRHNSTGTVNCSGNMPVFPQASQPPSFQEEHFQCLNELPLGSVWCFSTEVQVMKAERVMLLIGAGIIFVIVLIVSVWVIPRAAADISPIASPEGAVSSFWTFTIANVLFGLAMLGATFLTRSGVSIALLVFAGLGAFLFGLWLLDGAFAFAHHGPSMQAVTVVLFACVGGDWLAGISAFVGAVLLARFRKRKFRAI